jgi:hypothetical protein
MRATDTCDSTVREGVVPQLQFYTPRIGRASAQAHPNASVEDRIQGMKFHPKMYPCKDVSDSIPIVIDRSKLLLYEWACDAAKTLSQNRY